MSDHQKRSHPPSSVISYSDRQYACMYACMALPTERHAGCVGAMFPRAQEQRKRQKDVAKIGGEGGEGGDSRCPHDAQGAI